MKSWGGGSRKRLRGCFLTLTSLSSPAPPSQPQVCPETSFCWGRRVPPPQKGHLTPGPVAQPVARGATALLAGLGPASALPALPPPHHRHSPEGGQHPVRPDLRLPSKASSDPALQAGRSPDAESLSSRQRSRHVVLAQMQWP